MLAMQNIQLHHFPAQRVPDDQQGSNLPPQPAWEDQACLRSPLSHLHISLTHFWWFLISHGKMLVHRPGG